MILDLKKDFPLLDQNKHITFLDSGASTQKPDHVLETVRDFYTNHYANIHRGIYNLSSDSTILYDSARKKVADFIGVKHPSSVIFTRNTTEGINLVANTIGRQIINEGDEILVSIIEHHANFVPWQILAKEKKAVFRVVNINPETYELDMDDFRKKLSEKTKIVAMTMVSNVIGTETDYREITRLAHEAGALTVFDGAQYVPHHPVNLSDFDPDFFSFSGHKMLANDGIGVLYGRPELLNTMPPFLYGGDMIEEVTTAFTTFAEPPEKFEAGTPNMGGAVSLGAAIDYLNTIGMEAIQNHEIQLGKAAVEELSQIPGIKFYKNTDHIMNGIVSFNLEGIHAHDLATILAEDEVCVRAGQHCAAPLISFLGEMAVVRASFYLYNTMDDVIILRDSVKKAGELFRI